MAGHKLTLLGHPARKKIQTYLQRNDDLHGSTRRLAYADGVIAISGLDSGIELARDLYDVDLTDQDLLERFNAMAGQHGYEQALSRPGHLCAEGRLWMTLVARHSRYVTEHQQPRHRHPHPRHLHVWVYQIDSHNRPKEDSPCPNCRQWVRAEFLTLNGT